MIVFGANLRKWRTRRLTLGIFVAFSFMYIVINNHAQGTNNDVMEHQVVHIISLQELSKLREQNGMNQNSKDVILQRPPTSALLKPKIEPSISTAQHTPPQTQTYRNAPQSRKIFQNEPTTREVSENAPPTVAAPESQLKPEAKSSFNVTSLFHAVSGLRPATDMALIVSGTPDFPAHLTEWLTRMQQLYSQLFTREHAKFEDYYLNSTLSETLPILRDIPDNRMAQCQQFVIPENLPKVSIIIPFHNEQYSFLVRTLHSILDKTPASLVHEIILIDDASDKTNLVSAFPKYVRHLPRVRLYRSHKRQGLIRARLLGAMIASAPVLVFLDAHIECQQQWLQPLLQIVSNNPSTIAIPAINDMDTYTLEVEDTHLDVNKGDARSISGIFDWELNYRWTVDAYADSKQSPLTPVPTATIIGCAIVVNREFFFHIGAFDEDMYIWGGENLEISFRTWMCGGSIQVAPCSIVGHVFRQYLPYAFPHRNQVHVNLQRLADVWMDEYASIYYQTTHMPFIFSQNELRTLHHRRQLREQLKCKNFKWYLDNVAVKVKTPPPKSKYFGQLKSLHGCLSLFPHDIGGYSCVYHHPAQQFALTSDGLLRSFNGSCLNVDLNTGTVGFSKCDVDNRGMIWEHTSTDKSAEWLYVSTGVDKLCLTFKEDVPRTHYYAHYSAVVVTCSDSIDGLLWRFSHTVLHPSYSRDFKT